MSISIWDYEKPLDAMMLSHDHMAALVLKHEQQIKDIAAHLLELKQLGVNHASASKTQGEKQMTTAIEQSDYALNMEFKRREWVGLTDEEMKQCSYDAEGFTIGREVAMRAVEAKLKEKNGG